MSIKEVSGSLYAWDLADEGVNRCLDNLQDRASCNSAYLVALMHREKRPLHQRFYPHNPVRKYYCPEDSRAYWQPDLSCYSETRIKPLTSERDFLKGNDWLDVLIKEARARGMRTGAEISHTILDADVGRHQFADCLQRNVYGETVTRRALPCVNNPDVRGYLRGLFHDLVANHDVDYVQTCLVLFGQGGTGFARSDNEVLRLLGVAVGGCCCSACEAEARAQGFDWDRILYDVKHLADVATQRTLEAQHEFQVLNSSNMTASNLILENDGFRDWLIFRARSITGLFREIHEEIHAIRDGVEFRYNTYMAHPELAGLDFKSAFAWVDSVRESDYSDQLGSIDALQIKREKLYKIRRALGDKPLIAALGVRPKATPEILRAAVKIAVECGSDGLALGHYDGATMARLQAVTDGLREAEGQEIDWVPPSQTDVKSLETAS